MSPEPNLSHEKLAFKNAALIATSKKESTAEKALRAQEDGEAKDGSVEGDQEDEKVKTLE